MEKEYRGESGEIMLESTIIVTITLMILIAMMGLGYYLCQQAITYTIACETAENIADNYKYILNTSLDDRNISIDEATSLKKYRNLFSLSSIKRECEAQAQTFVHDRAAFTLSKLKGSFVSIDFSTDNVGRTHVTATVSIEANTLFLGALQYEGFGVTKQFVASANAECLDLTGYAGQVGLVDYLGRRVNDTNMGSIVNNVAGMKKNIETAVGKMKEMCN